MRDPDEELVQRVGAGDKRAAAELVRRHLPRMVGLARRMLGDAAEAEEGAADAAGTGDGAADDGAADDADPGTAEDTASGV